MGTKNNPGAYDCYQNAAPDEPVFTLRAKDPAAAAAIRFWMKVRYEMKKRAGEFDEREQAKQEEAERCAVAMEEWRNGGETMPKGEFSTPGPFWLDDKPGFGGAHHVLRGDGHLNVRHVVTLPGRLDEEERDELVGLLNKGTHFERLRDALEDMTARFFRCAQLGGSSFEAVEAATADARNALDACRSPETEAAEAQADAGMAAYREMKGDG